MASHSLAIAKASLAAVMIRPDPTSIPKTEIAHFHVILEAMLRQCSPKNIQLCKEWLLKNIIPSAARTVAIGKYLVALSGSFKRPAEGDEPNPRKEEGPSGRRRQLYILYLLNDLLHHTKYHSGSILAQSTFTASFQSHLADLLGSASAYSPDVYASQHKKIQELLDIWESNGYYQSSYIGKLRDTVSNTARLSFPNNGDEPKADNGAGYEASGEEKREAPYIMPASHGDPSTPFYDLPAGNLLPHIMPNSATPINPQLVKPLQLVAGPADESLAIAVKDFLQKVESLDIVSFGDDGTDMDLDELGQSVLRDEITGDVLEGEGYYGWSRKFCERMKRRGEDIGDFSKVVRRDVSMDRSLSPRKRRRYSDSGSSRSRGRSRSSSLSSREGTRYRNGRPSSSRSRNESREQKQYHTLRSRSRSRPKSKSASYSPPQTTPAFQQPPSVTNAQPSFQAHPQGPSPPPPPFSQGFPLGPGGVPIPPPPPPNYQGQWPPPPPPPMPNPNAACPLDFAPQPPPPTGPRVYQNQGPPTFPPGSQSNFQGQLPQHPGAWGQQSPHSGGYFQGGRGRGAPPFNANTQNGRGRGFGRGGWGR